MGRYFFKSFDALTVPIQHYADWLWKLKGKGHEDDTRHIDPRASVDVGRLHEQRQSFSDGSGTTRQITLNQSTKEDVKRILGKPNSVTKQSGSSYPLIGAPPISDLTNVEVWTYSHVSMNIDGVTFIPIVGLFAGGGTAHINTYTAVFDEAGLVRRISSNQTESRSGRGSNPTK